MLIIGPWVDLGSASIRIPTLFNPPVKNRCQLSSGYTLSYGFTSVRLQVPADIVLSFPIASIVPKISAIPGSPEFVSIRKCSCGLC